MRILFAVLFFVILCSMPGIALAQCQIVTIVQGDTVRICQVCTEGGNTTILCA